MFYKEFQPVMSQDQARKSDNYTINKLLVNEEFLIECAGLSVAHEAKNLFDQSSPLKSQEVLVFAGLGNNGADALVAARHLVSLNIKTTVLILGKQTDLKPSCNKQLSLLENIRDSNESSKLLLFLEISPTASRIEQICLEIAKKDCVIIDGIFGSGLNKIPQGLGLIAIQAINSLHSTAKILAVDIPSGLSLNATHPLGEVVRAHKTVTFEHLKQAHISEPTKIFCGCVIVKNIGLFESEPYKFFHYSKKIPLNYLLKPIAKTSHKGNFGHVLVMEGEPRFMGASRLAARSALRTGAGLVSILISDINNPHPSDLAEFIKITKEEFATTHFDSLVVGPGLSKTKEFQHLAMDIFIKALKNSTKAIILDASGLDLLKNMEKSKKSDSEIVCTPHPKEAAEFLNISTVEVEKDRFLAIKMLREQSRKYPLKIIWVLKGAVTLVAPPSGEVYSFAGDVPLLSVGGSGDILSGAIAGLSAQTACLLDAVLLGISLQIAAADGHNKGMMPHELTDRFPNLLNRIVI